MPARIWMLVALFIGAWVLPAQDLSPIRLEIDNLARSDPPDEGLIADLRDSLYKVRLLDPGTFEGLAGTAAEGEDIYRRILAFRRADIQSGASSGAAGSTSAVSNPLLPAIFGVGLETGSITRTVTGTTMTLKVNPAGLFCASGKDAAAVALRAGENCRTFWNRVGITASFDTGRGALRRELADLRALGSQFAEFSTRVELVNHRKASGERFRSIFAQEIERWRKDAQELADVSAKAAAEAFETSMRNRAEEALLKLVAEESYLKASPPERAGRIEKVVRDVLAEHEGELSNAMTRRRLWLDSLRSSDNLQRHVANASVLTAEYSYQKPDLTTEAAGPGAPPPALHSLRFLYAKGWADNRLDLTANAGAAFFGEARPGMRGNFREFRTAVEARFTLRDIPNYGAPTLSFAGLYVFLNQEPLGLGLVAFNQAQIRERGHIGLFQTKFEFPTASNAIRIPLSFTYSNRTELIKEKEVRGQVGISFNLDTLFAEGGGLVP